MVAATITALALLSGCQTAKPLQLSPQTVDIVLNQDGLIAIEESPITLPQIKSALISRAVTDRTPLKIHYHSLSPGDRLRLLDQTLEDAGFTVRRYVEYSD
jgi:hypothetical protein